MREVSLIIGDRRIAPSPGGSAEAALDVFCPATGRKVAVCAVASVEDAGAAVDAASDAFTRWRAEPAAARAELLNAVAEKLDAGAARLADIITEEQGKPHAEALGEASFISSEFRLAAEETMRLRGEILPAPAPDIERLVYREPVGVVIALPSSNYPAAIAARKISALIAAGCTCVIRAPEEAPSAAAFIAEACLDASREAGAPPGLVNLLCGNPANVTAALVRDPRIGLVSFTGSERVGREVLGNAAASITPAVVELGGAAPVIVCADADIEEAARLICAKKHENAGQNCAAPNTILVEKDAYELFVSTYWREMQSVRVGAGDDAETTMGPLISARAVDAMAARVERLAAEGADIRRLDIDPPSTGSFAAPTLAAGAPAASGILQEEFFAPLTAVSPVADLDEAIRIANSGPLGLVAYAFTRSQARAHRLVRELEVGSIAVNKTGVGDLDAPFGGVKQSGFGAEGGAYGVEAFLKPKFASLRRL